MDKKQEALDAMRAVMALPEKERTEALGSMKWLLSVLLEEHSKIKRADMARRQAEVNRLGAMAVYELKKGGGRV